MIHYLVVLLQSARPILPRWTRAPGLWAVSTWLMGQHALHLARVGSAHCLGVPCPLQHASTARGRCLVHVQVGFGAVLGLKCLHWLATV